MDSSRPGAAAQEFERGEESAGPLHRPRLSVVSLGGCTLAETVKRLDPDRFQHLRHFWRRPTLALVAPPAPSTRPLPPLPEPFRAYFEKDASKAHLDELLNCGAEVVIMDLTRDLLTGVIDLGGGAFVLNPLDARDYLDWPPAETFSDADFAATFGDCPQLSSRADFDQFFAYWAPAMTELLDRLRRRFPRVVVCAHYYASAVCDESSGLDLESVAALNCRLRRMYDFIRSSAMAEVISIPERFYLTARDVALGGPHPSHFVEPAYVCLAYEIENLFRPDCLWRVAGLADQYFRSALTQDRLSKEKCAWEAEKEQLLSRIDVLGREGERLSALQAETKAALDEAAREKLRLAEALHALSADNRRLSQELDARAAESDALAARNASLSDEKRQAVAEKARLDVQNAALCRELQELGAQKAEMAQRHEKAVSRLFASYGDLLRLAFKTPFVSTVLNRRGVALLDELGFDPAFYLAKHPDVAESRMSPALHFLRHGCREGRALRLRSSG